MTDMINHPPHYRGEGGLEAIDVIDRGVVDVDRLVTHRLPLERAGEAFAMMASAGKSVKILLYPHGVPD